MTLCTQTDIESFLQIEFDNDPEPVVDYLIEGSDALVIDYLGFNPEAEDNVAEIHDPTMTINLWVRRPPIRALTSVTLNGDTVDGDAYTTYLQGEDRSGLIRRVDGGRWNGNPRGITVTYDAGFDPVPFSIRDASVRIASRAFQQGVAFAAAGAMPGVRSIALAGSDSITWSESADDVAKGALELGPAERSMLSPYKKGWVV